MKNTKAQQQNVRSSILCIMNPLNPCIMNLSSAKRSFTTVRLSQYMFAVGLNASDPSMQTWFYTVGLLPRGIEQLWMFFLKSVRSWLVPTWYSSRCQRTEWLPWLGKIRIGMSWCNAGRGRSPSWLMATRTEWDLWSRVCFACGWDAVSPEPGNNCGLNLDPTSRMKTQPLSSVISFSSAVHLFVVSTQSPKPRKILHLYPCLSSSVLFPALLMPPFFFLFILFSLLIQFICL